MSEGTHNILRVIATFPAQLALEIAEDADRYPLASLNMDLVGNAFPLLHGLIHGRLTKRKAEDGGEGQPDTKKGKVVLMVDDDVLKTSDVCLAGVGY
jgi:hypothetical protein